MNNVDIKTEQNNVVVLNNGNEVFRKPKTRQTVAIANDIYFYYKYKDKEIRC